MIDCCGALPPPAEGEHEATSASGRRLDLWTRSDGAAFRRTWRTFPFTLVALDEGRTPRRAIARLPALLTVTAACSGAACAEAEAIVLGIGYDEQATRRAVRGVAGPGTSGAPLRTDGLPRGQELPPLRPGMPAPPPPAEVYTPDICERA